MKATPSPRLPEAIKEAIRQHIAGRTGAAPVQVSRLLRDVRSAVDTTHLTDDDLIEQIVMDATDHGLSVHFDLEVSDKLGRRGFFLSRGTFIEMSGYSRGDILRLSG